MGKQVSILLVGIGGYGEVYVNSLLNHESDDKWFICGIVDPKPENCRQYSKITARNIPVFNNIEDFYKKSTADLAVISSPIQYHCSQSCFALKNHSNVLCEKPICATIPDAISMIKAKDEANRFLAIGYQWSYSNAIQDLKRDVIKGVFGRPKRLKTIVLWPRNDAYYKREWAGKKVDRNGNWIWDSVANNATAHYLHNMFYILGEKIDSSIRPEYVTAELYRANSIENFDTSAVRIVTKSGIEMMFFASHAVGSSLGPIFEYEFEDAVVSFDYGAPESLITAVFKDGKTKFYGNPSSENNDKKLWVCIDSVRGKGAVPCGPEAAVSHTLCINAMQKSMPDIRTFPSDMIKIEEDPLSVDKTIYAEGLDNILVKCYESWSLPAEMGVCWATKGKSVFTDDRIR